MLPNPPISPTPYPEVNAILGELLAGVQGILGSHLVGMYLEGSLASGDFDLDSDVDFVVVADQDVTQDFFPALQVLHERIARLDSWCAIQLEGSYLPQSALRRHDPQHTLYPNLERGQGERLKLADHDETWIIHRFILRECGITLCGPAPQTLIDPIAPDDLRRAMLPELQVWATGILNAPHILSGRGYQSYTALSVCRILYTLQFGEVVSKPRAAAWAKEALGPQWRLLLERTWEGRHNPQWPASADDIRQTLDFIRFALERSRQMDIPPDESSTLAAPQVPHP